jgi:hypothetical protein
VTDFGNGVGRALGRRGRRLSTNHLHNEWVAPPGGRGRTGCGYWPLSIPTWSLLNLGLALFGERVCIGDAGERRRARGARDPARALALGPIYLQIITGNQKLPFSVFVRNLPILLKVRMTATARIRSLMMHVLENPHFDAAGPNAGRAQMILGLLYKAKRKRADVTECRLKGATLKIKRDSRDGKGPVPIPS